MIDPLYVASGFGVGLLVGMTGVGGGSLMTPLLILLFGIHPSTAVGTDLLYAAATKTGGSVVHGWSRSVHWPAVLRLACGSLPASALTLLVLWKLDLKSDSERNLVNLVLCFALLLTATSLIFRRSIMERYRRRLEQVDDRATAIATVVTGIVLGVLVSISSVGAGGGRRHRSAAALSAPAGGDHRRVRHRPCGPADADRRNGALGAWRRGLGADGRAAVGLAARHRRRQL
ncbi:putative membrane protein YfcA [Bradyrhizobium sp. GM7.3]